MSVGEIWVHCILVHVCNHELGKYKNSVSSRLPRDARILQGMYCFNRLLRYYLLLYNSRLVKVYNIANIPSCNLRNFSA